MNRSSNLIALLFVAAGSQSACGGDTTIRDRFLSEYSEYASRLEDFYRNIDLTEEVSGKFAVRIFGGNATIHWQSSGPKFRDDLISKNGVIVTSKLSLGDVNCRIYSTEADNRTGLANLAGKQKYSLTEVHNGSNSRILGLARTGCPRLAFAPYCVYSSSVKEFLMRDVITVKSVENVGRKVSVKYTAEWNEGRVSLGELIFDKERCWAVIEDRKDGLLGKIEYGDSVSGVPIVRRGTYWHGDAKEPTFISVVSDIKPGPAPDSVFSLADFGLPELQRRTKGTFFLATLGIIGLVVAIVLTWLIRRWAAPKVKVS